MSERGGNYIRESRESKEAIKYVSCSDVPKQLERGRGGGGE